MSSHRVKPPGQDCLNTWDLSTLKILWCLIKARRKYKLNKKRFCNIMEFMHQGSGKELQEIRGLTNSFCSWSNLFLIHTSTCLHTVSNQEKILWMGISIARANVKWKGDNRKGQVKAKRRSPGWASDSRHRRPPSLVTPGRDAGSHWPPQALLWLWGCLDWSCSEGGTATLKSGFILHYRETSIWNWQIFFSVRLFRNQSLQLYCTLTYKYTCIKHTLR